MYQVELPDFWVIQLGKSGKLLHIAPRAILLKGNVWEFITFLNVSTAFDLEIKADF
jgi:hypothetical protein